MILIFYLLHSYTRAVIFNPGLKLESPDKFLEPKTLRLYTIHQLN